MVSELMEADGGSERTVGGQMDLEEVVEKDEAKVAEENAAIASASSLTVRRVH